MQNKKTHFYAQKVRKTNAFDNTANEMIDLVLLIVIFRSSDKNIFK